MAHEECRRDKKKKKRATVSHGWRHAVLSGTSACCCFLNFIQWWLNKKAAGHKCKGWKTCVWSSVNLSYVAFVGFLYLPPPLCFEAVFSVHLKHHIFFPFLACWTSTLGIIILLLQSLSLFLRLCIERGPALEDRPGSDIYPYYLFYVLQTVQHKLWSESRKVYLFN